MLRPRDSVFQNEEFEKIYQMGSSGSCVLCMKCYNGWQGRDPARDRNSSGQRLRRQQYQAAMTSGSEGGDGDTAVSDHVVVCRNFPLEGRIKVMVVRRKEVQEVVSIFRRD